MKTLELRIVFKYGIELISNETYILEANFIKMSG